MKKQNKHKTNNISVEVKRIEQKRTVIAKQMFLDVFLIKACSISESCKAAGIGRTAYYEWMEKDKKFRAAVTDCKEALIDYVESKQMQGIEDGSEQLIKFFLERKAKHRGYGDKTDVAVDIKITHTYIKPKEIKNGS